MHTTKTARTVSITIASLTLASGAFASGSFTDRSGTQSSAQGNTVIRCGTPDNNQWRCEAPPRVEVVFVLDTTGSMGGLIEGAKQKIWSIATRIAQAQPSPEIRMGLVGYRDRGDTYITKRTALTDDLDALYTDLMGYQARGGGDTPESVNEALFESIERFDWSEGDDVLKIVYLVGDAPPQMDYDDDVKYLASCKLARESGILINTVQCGSLHGTERFWREIARHASGSYARIRHDSGVQSSATPYDDEIARLDRELMSLMIDYGDSETMGYQIAKRARGARVAASSAPEAAADRAIYNQSEAGASNLYGRQELVRDVVEGRVDLDDVERDHLPEAMQKLQNEELAALVMKNAARRAEIESALKELGKKRAEHQAAMVDAAPSDSFDLRVLETLKMQAAKIGLRIGAAGDQPGRAD